MPRPRISCPRARRTRLVGSQTRRSSRCARAQAIVGIRSDRRFLAVARGTPRPRVPRVARAARVPQTPPPRRTRPPGFHDDLSLPDSAPVQSARSRETVKRFALGDAVARRPSASTAPTPAGCRPGLPDRCQRRGGEVLLGDGGYASRGFAAQAAEPDATFVRPAPQGRTPNTAGPRPHPPADRIDLLDPQTPPHPQNATAPAPTPPSKNASPYASAASPPRSPPTPTHTQQLVNYSA
jgi:hypothetical protein